MLLRCVNALFISVMVLTGSLSADEPVLVEVFLPREQAPSDLKAGDRVDLLQVLSETITRKGIASYTTSTIAKNLEVSSIKKDEKPKESWKALTIVLKATKEQARNIKSIQSRTVTVTTNDTQGNLVTSQRPIPMRVQFSKK